MSEHSDLSPVYIANYDHIGVILWGVAGLEQNLSEELERLERHPNFRIGWDHEAYAYDYLAAHEPALLRRMQEALAHFKGRLGIGSSSYGQPLAQFINEESNVRQLTMAMDTIEKRFGYRLSVYIMSEHAMHSQMPQLLAACGFEAAILRTHYMMHGYNPTTEAPVVWWVGLDGSHIRAVPTYPGQEVDVTPAHTHPFGAHTLDDRILTDYPAECAVTLDAFRQLLGHKIRPLVATRANDARQNEEIIRAHESDPEYIWLLVEDILPLLSQPRVDLRTEPNAFKVRMPWGLCGNWIWNRSRQAETSLLTAERLATLCHALGGPLYEADLDAAWKDLLVAQHHDVQVLALEAEASTHLDAATKVASDIIRESMDRVAQLVVGEGLRRWVVFNPVPWERTDWIPTHEGGGFVATVPGLAARAFPAVQVAQVDRPAIEWEPEQRRLRTSRFDLYLGQKGGLAMLFDRQACEHVLMPGRPSGTLAGLIDGQPCESEVRAEVRVEADRALVQEAGTVGPIPYRGRWTVYADLPRIDWQAEFEIHGQRIGRLSEDQLDPLSAFEHEQKLRLRFYPRLRVDATGIRDLPFAVAETPDRNVEGNYWTAVSDNSVGLAILNRGLMGAVREGDGAFSVPLAFSMYYIWSGAYPGKNIFLDGTYRYELSMLPFSGDWRQADLHRRAIEYNFPCVAMEANGASKNPLVVWRPFVAALDGAVLSALYNRGGRTFARFYEPRGARSEVSVEWLGKPAYLIEVDLRERPMARLGHTLPLGPWQVRTVRIAD